jgi:hypothetical protein
MLDLPRSVRLALWGTAALHDRVAAADAVTAVTGDDEPHTAAGDDVLPVRDGRTVLGDLLGQLHAGSAGLRAVLPVPGDVLGLPGPRAVNEQALDAGEAVVTVPRVPGEAVWALVPAVTRFGSELEPGAVVHWQVHRTSGLAATDFAGLAEAEQALRLALVESTETLTALDVARWRDDAADRIAMVRDGGLPRGAVPEGTPGRVVRVLSTAARVRAIVALAGEDDGAAVTGWDAAGRARTLRAVDQVARRAMVAACDPMAVRQAASP